MGSRRRLGSVEDLVAVPLDVVLVHWWMSRLRIAERSILQFVSESMPRPGRSDEGVSDLDVAVRGQADDAEIEQLVVQRAQRDAVGRIVRAVLGMPADVGGFEPDRLLLECSVPPAHRARVGVGTKRRIAERRISRTTSDDHVDAVSADTVEFDPDSAGDRLDV